MVNEIEDIYDISSLPESHNDIAASPKKAIDSESIASLSSWMASPMAFAVPPKDRIIAIGGGHKPMTNRKSILRNS